jgi:hypothetical protein
MKIHIAQFAGERPIVAEHLLPENYATKTINARHEGGSLIPIKDLAITPAVVDSDTASWCIYPFDKTKEITRSDEADFVRGPLANDAWRRVYSTGSELPPQLHYMVSGGIMVSTVNLGIKKPPMPTVPTEWQLAVPPSPDDQVVRCAYYVTSVTARGEESEPSETTVIINRWDGAAIPVTLGASNDVRADKRRLYRSEGGGVFNLVVEVPVANTGVSDDVISRRLGAPCTSESYNEPSEKMQGLTMVGNGFMAGFFDNTLCFCEPYYPHAWPIDYQYSFHDEIVGIAVISGAIVVTTTGSPWMVMGSHPSSMNPVKLDLRVGNLSRRGMVDMGSFALYPSTEGLVMASNSGMQIVSQDIISRSQWLSLDPASFNAFRYRGQYLCFSSIGAFIFDLKYGIFPLEVTGNSADRVLSGYYQTDEDTLYLLIEHSDLTKSIYKFDSGSNKELFWTSREFIMDRKGVISSCRIDGDESATIKIEGGNYLYEKTASSDKGFRLPAGRPLRIKVSIKSTGRINTLSLASSMGELL